MRRHDRQSLDVETFEHDLGRVLTVLRSVEGRLGLYDSAYDQPFRVDPCIFTLRIPVDPTHEQNIVILGLGSQILEDRLGPEPLHQVPVIDLTMFDRALHVVRL